MPIEIEAFQSRLVDVENAAPSQVDCKLSGRLSGKLVGKRVVFVVNSDSGGGVEHIADMLGSFVRRHGALPVSIFLYPKDKASLFLKLSSLARAAFDIITARADVIVTFQPTSSVLAMMLGRLLGCKIRIAHQSNLPETSHPIVSILDRVCGSLGFYTVNVMNSNATRAAFRMYPRRYQSCIREIAHGVTWQAPTKTVAEVREELAIPHGAKVLMTCSRLSEGKALDTIIRALPMLERMHFIIAGDGPELESLAGCARDLNVDHRVHFLGYVVRDHLCDLHEAADVFVFPSVRETFGLAVLEAAMHGVPVVASSIPALREVMTLDNHTPARFVDNWDAENWARVVQEVISDPKRVTRALEFAPRFREHYSEQRMLERYGALFEELIP